jgi:Fe-S-cluster-containing dehydrogenase component
VLVNAINEAIGANGKTINWATQSQNRQGVDAEMLKLVSDMNASAIGALLIAGANPSYDYYDADKFNAALAKVPVSVSFNTRFDETTERCKLVIPDHHYLESWGDASPKTGYVSFIQPTIYPLFKTRQWQDTLLQLMGSGSGAATVAVAAAAATDSLDSANRGTLPAGNDYLSYLKNYWMATLGSQEAWDKALRDGVVSPVTMPIGAATFNGGVVAAATSAANATPAGGKWQVQFYEKVSIGSGSQGSNPWLQELPDPITKATWDNYAVISAAAAKELLNIDLTDNGDLDSYEVNPAKPVIKIAVNGKTIALPALIVPGTDAYTIGIALGYGRGEKVGVAAAGAGQNAFRLTTLTGANVSLMGIDAKVEKTGEKYEIAQNQVHGSYEGRVEVVRETSLAAFVKNPTMFKHERDKLVEEYAPKTEDYRNEGSLYDPRLNDRPGMKWGMSIDLNSCTGCGACVVACNAENNIPVVGKAEVLRGHDMHWMRIDRYYVTKAGANPDELTDVVFMPMLCQHCDNAPCENVCPVAATNHSSEGLNQMTYNRCIGTRYCANNCPYKVRRFNWADYTGADSFKNNQVGHVSDVTLEMNDELTRMVLNPDVTVRSRGVIEKCSFCVQRLQAGKLEAKKQNRPVNDGEIKVACQQACPSEAIVFGDSNDKKSAIAGMRDHNPLRLYYALEQVHVLPNVNYLAKVRNTDELPAHDGHESKPKAAAAAHG